MKDVQAGAADRAIREGAFERRLVHDVAASDVDEPGVGAHRAELWLGDEAFGAGGERQGEDDVVGTRQEVGHALGRYELVDVAHASLAAAAADDAHAERLRESSDLAADMADADDADGLAGELVRLD